MKPDFVSSVCRADWNRCRRRRFQATAIIAGLAWGTVLLTSCSRESSTVPAQTGVRAPVPVLAAQAETRDIPVELQAIGNVQAYSAVSIRSQITGPITKVHFQEGQEVTTGDLLFTIDPRPWEAAVNQARANLIKDEAHLVSSQLEFLRTSNLFYSKIASQQDFDTAEANYRGQEATLLADHAAITNAEVSLGYTAIRSPITGRTGNLVVKEGNVVKAPDDVILTIMQTRPIYVAFSVPEQNLPAIRRQSDQKELPVEAVVPSEPDRPQRGSLTFINNTVDTNTGTILLKGTFLNDHNVLWPGQYVRVFLALSNLVHATVVPSQAVQTGQNGEFIFVVKSDQTVEARPVSTGVTYDGVMVITSGVEPGETVVTDGQLRLVPGAKINLKTSPSAESPTNRPTVLSSGAP
jgi:membrane fusion protein, multidrug efflux system